MFAATVEAGKLQRALDLVERLSLEKSFDLAMTIADNHRRLVDLIEDVKERKFGAPEDHEGGDYDDSSPPDDCTHDGGGNIMGRPRISPDVSARNVKRDFDEGFDNANRNVRSKQSFPY
jgi:hypothetical protein